MVSPMIDDMFANNKDNCIMLYGHSGTGKSYTIFGNKEQSGILQHSIDEINKKIDENTNIKVLFVQSRGKSVWSMIDQSQILTSVQPFSLSRVLSSVRELSEVKDQLSNAPNKCRFVRETSDNKQSSRTHALIQLIVEKNNENICTFTIIDLAGSESINVESNAAVEGREINQDLTTLKVMFGNHVENLSKGAYNGHGSAITGLISKALDNGNLKLICTVSLANEANTQNTLEFSKLSSKIISTAPSKKQQSCNNCKQLKEKNEKLQAALDEATQCSTSRADISVVDLEKLHEESRSSQNEKNELQKLLNERDEAIAELKEQLRHNASFQLSTDEPRSSIERDRDVSLVEPVQDQNFSIQEPNDVELGNDVDEIEESRAVEALPKVFTKPTFADVLQYYTIRKEQLRATKCESEMRIISHFIDTLAEVENRGDDILILKRKTKYERINFEKENGSIVCNNFVFITSTTMKPFFFQNTCYEGQQRFC